MDAASADGAVDADGAVRADGDVDASADGSVDAGSFVPPDGGSSGGMPAYVAHYGGAGSDQGYDVTVASDGTVIVVGTFQASFSFGTTLIVSSGAVDGFVATFDSSGATRWSHPIGGAGNDRAQGVEVDALGRSYVCGLFESLVDFGGTMLTAAGMSDAFVSSYDTSGGLRWVRGMGAAGADFAYDVAVAPSGDLLVTGYYQGAVDFGSGALPAYGGRDVFVAKYTSDGTPVWSRGYGSSGDDSGQGIAVGADGRVIVTGNLAGPADFGAGTIGAAGSGFVLELAADGTHAWSTALAAVTPWDVDVHRPDGRILVGARAAAGADLGMGAITTAGLSDGLVISYAADHTLEWYRVFGGTLDDLGLGITTDAAGDSYMIGLGGADIDFGMGLVTGNGGQDVFVVSHDRVGATRWGRLFGGAVQDRGYGVAVAPGGGIYVTGRYAGTAELGTGPIPSAGLDDIFLVRLD